MTRLPFLPAAFALMFSGQSQANPHSSPAEDVWRPNRQPRVPGWGEARRARYDHPSSQP